MSDYFILDYQQDEKEVPDPTDWEYAMCRQEQLEKEMEQNEQS